MDYRREALAAMQSSSPTTRMSQHKLLDFALASDRKFLFFDEPTVRNMVIGGGIGIAYRAHNRYYRHAFNVRGSK